MNRTGKRLLYYSLHSAAILGLLLFFLGPLISIAQSDRIYFDHITTKEGLSQNDVNTILQDQKGFMWFGTNDGLNRYDGYEFTIFKPDPSNPYAINSNLILSLAEDSLGRIWVGTVGSGLNCFDPATQRFYTFQDDSISEKDRRKNHIRSLLSDQQGHLWVGSISGLKLFNLHIDKGLDANLDDELTSSVIPKELQGSYIESIFQDREGIIWIGGEAGLFRAKHPTNKGDLISIERINIPAPFVQGLYIRAISEDVDNRLVLVTNVGLYYQVGTDDLEMPIFERFSTLSASFLGSSGSGQIWVTSVQGLQLFTKSRTQRLPTFSRTYTSNLYDPHSLNKDVLRLLYTDRNGMIWVGTNGGGINKFDPEQMVFRHYKRNFQAGSISYDKIRSIFEDSQGNIWIGTEGGGLNFLYADTEDLSYDQFQYLPTPTHVFAMAEVKEENEQILYFGGQSIPGLYTIPIPTQANAFDPEAVQSIPEINQSVFAILNQDDRFLWVGMYNGGLVKLNLKSAEVDMHQYQHQADNPQSISSDIVRSLLMDQNGNLWVGTGDGLNRIQASEASTASPSFQRFRHQSDDHRSISHNYILALYESRSGRIWIGTLGGGLNAWIPPTGKQQGYFLRYSEKDGLASNVVKGILEDDQGFLWISGNKGLTRFDPVARTFKNYDTNDGLQSDEFGELACMKRRNGDMLFGGVDGFNVFRPDVFRENPHPPTVVFTDLQILNKPIEVGQQLNGHVILENPISETKQIHLDHDQNSFSLAFAALHYSSPNKNKYKYKLEGFDRKWINVDAKKRFATYTNLEPGTYTIHVMASNNDGLWNEEPASIAIYISPPFWRTWWAYLLYALLVVALLLAVQRYTLIGIQEKHELKLEHLEKEKAEELHQMKLQFFTNISHELRTPLTLISGPLEYLIRAGQGLDYGQREKQYHLIQKNADFLLRLVNQLLEFRKVDKGNTKLQVQKRDIVGFISEITEPFQFIASKKQIVYKAHSKEAHIEAWFDPDILEKTLYNLLSNAFKFTPDKGCITVEIEPDVRKQTFIGSLPWRQSIVIRIRDTGPGISAAQKEQIFERFYKSSSLEVSNEYGTGIGLAFTKSLVELHHGTIHVESDVGQGSCFVVRLPMEKSAYAKAERARLSTPTYQISFDPLLYLSDPIDEQESKHQALVTEPDNEKKALPVLLVVDDHPDIRQFIHLALTDQFQVVEAADGSQGLELAMEHMPDMIISDVMMPEMDGIELCSRLKTDPKTSHIPVILLTAKSSEESELEGLTTGADAYIRKPFNMDILKVQMMNILRQRQELKNRFRQELLLEPEEITVTSADEVFLKQAMSIIEEHMGNPDFNVEVMVKAIGMSRSKLYLKLKALTDQSTSEFIRTIRLKRAVQLLEKSDMTVKEIMYMTGFNTASYFSKCFKKQFGMVPSEYVKQILPAQN